MKQVIIAIILIVVCTTTCNAYSKQMIKANKALLALERKQNATQKDQQKVVDMLQEVINNATYILDKCEASIELAECYSENVPEQIRDYAKAGELYKNALELVCEQYPSTDTDQADDVKNLKWKAFYNTGYYCYYKRTSSQDLSKALEYFTEAAYYAPRFHRAVGEFYELGLGCDIDPEMALMHYTEAMHNGTDSHAKFYSTEYYVNQVSADKLDTLAFNDFREGILLQKMAGEQINYDQVKQHLTAAAERGYSPAQFELGTAYLNGKFSGGKSDENLKQAEEWLKKAADDNYLPALGNLAYFYETGGKGYASDKGREKALPYYEQAAMGGYPPAQCALAVYYYMGFAGKEKSILAAQYWLECSADKGYKLAKDYLANLKSEIESAQKRKEEAEKRKEYEREHALDFLANALSDLGNTISNTISKRHKMTSSQVATMKRSSYKAEKNVNSTNNTSYTSGNTRTSSSYNSRTSRATHSSSTNSQSKSEQSTKKKCQQCNGAGYKQCRTCDGTGKIKCTQCGGDGQVTSRYLNSHNKMATLNMKCTACNGKGKKNDLVCGGKGTKKCVSCNGKGYY